jgi:hypothetical protein
MATTQVLHRVMPKHRSEPKEPLLTALAKLHVIPFTAKSVAEYKLNKLIEVAKTNPPKMLKYARKAGIMRLAKGLLSKPTLLGLEEVVNLSVVAQWTNPYGNTTDGTARIRRPFYWNRVSLTDYELAGGELPDGVGKTVARITKDVPDAEFAVDTLRSGKEEVFDPFLVVKRGEEEFTIAVWDETYKP